MDSELRRLVALVRDERANSTAGQFQEDRRFDVDAVVAARDKVENLLETLSFFAQDHALWGRLRAQTEVLPHETLDSLDWFDDGAFGHLLVASGYESPPPPPVDELIADTRYAIRLGMREGPRPELVDAAQRSLLTFLYRARRQIGTAPGPGHPDVVAGVGRGAGVEARRLIPIAIGALGGGAVELLIPGTGIGFVIGSGAKALVEHGLEMAATTAAGLSVVGQPRQPDATREAPLITPQEAMAAHLAAAQMVLSNVGSRHLDEAESADVVTVARRHVGRLVELAGDHGGRDSISSAARLALEQLQFAQPRDFRQRVENSDTRSEYERMVALHFAAQTIAECSNILAGRADLVLSNGPFGAYVSADFDEDDAIAVRWQSWRNELFGATGSRSMDGYIEERRTEHLEQRLRALEEERQRALADEEAEKQRKHARDRQRLEDERHEREQKEAERKRNLEQKHLGYGMS